MSVSTSPSGIAAVVDEFIVCSTYSDRTSISSKDFSKFSMTCGREGVRAEMAGGARWPEVRAEMAGGARWPEVRGSEIRARARPRARVASRARVRPRARVAAVR